MKKLFFIFLIGTFAFSQEKLDSIDNVNRMLLNALSKLEISNNAQRDYLIHRIDSISNTSIDPVVKEIGKKAINDLRQLQFLDAKAKPLSELSKDELKGYKVEYDKFKKLTFIKARSGWTDGFYPYIVLSDDGELFLRMFIQYRGSNWIFFNRIQLIIDGQDFFFSFDEPKREVLSGGSVREYVDVMVDEDMFEMLQAVADAKSKIDIRFSGEKFYDKKIGLKEAEITKRILDLFDKLKVE